MSVPYVDCVWLLALAGWLGLERAQAQQFPVCAMLELPWLELEWVWDRDVLRCTTLGLSWRNNWSWCGSGTRGTLRWP